jgi:hypothetical protein
MSRIVIVILVNWFGRHESVTGKVTALNPGMGPTALPTNRHCLQADRPDRILKCQLLFTLREPLPL